MLAYLQSVDMLTTLCLLTNLPLLVSIPRFSLPLSLSPSLPIPFPFSYQSVVLGQSWSETEARLKAVFPAARPMQGVWEQVRGERQRRGNVGAGEGRVRGVEARAQRERGVWEQEREERGI